MRSHCESRTAKAIQIKFIKKQKHTHLKKQSKKQAAGIRAANAYPGKRNKKQKHKHITSRKKHFNHFSHLKYHEPNITTEPLLFNVQSTVQRQS